MIDWIRSLFCSYKWKCVRHGDFRLYDSEDRMWFTTGHYKDYICDVCLKKRRVKW